MKKIFYVVGVLVIVSIGFFAFLYQYNYNKYDFQAQSIDGNVSLKSFDGKYKVLYFGYVFCPDVCPTSLNMVSTVLNDIKAKDVDLLFVTLDPKRDDVKSCDEFAKYFYKDAYCLRITPKEKLDKVVENYGSKYKIVKQEDSAMEYSVAHSSFLYLFDKKGRMVKEISDLTYNNVKKEFENLLKNY